MRRLQGFCNINGEFFLTATERVRVQGTNTGHENGGSMASVGVRVERPVRHGRKVEGDENTTGLMSYLFVG